MWRAARVLFGLSGALWLVIGVLTPILLDRWTGQRIVFVSARTDAALFGRDPAEMLATGSALTILRGMLLRALSGLLVTSGLLTVGIAWFGMREPATWGLAVLTAVGVLVVPYWWVALTPYRSAGIRLTLGDLPPFMWVPAILMPLASAMAWVEHLRS